METVPSKMDTNFEGQNGHHFGQKSDTTFCNLVIQFPANSSKKLIKTTASKIASTFWPKSVATFQQAKQRCFERIVFENCPKWTGPGILYIKILSNCNHGFDQIVSVLNPEIGQNLCPHISKTSPIAIQVRLGGLRMAPKIYPRGIVFVGNFRRLIVVPYIFQTFHWQKLHFSAPNFTNRFISVSGIDPATN